MNFCWLDFFPTKNGNDTKLQEFFNTEPIPLWVQQQKRAAKLNKSFKILHTSELPAAMIKELAVVFLTV